MKILIISDLHVGMKARAQELCPYPEGKYKDDKLVSSFIEYATNYQKEKGRFDYLVLPGDITHQSNLVEYDCGNKFLLKIIDELSINEDRIIFVPGNHDVDWSILEGTTIYEVEKQFRKKHKYNTLKDKNHVFSKLTSNELVEFPFIKKWEFNDAIFFGFNSSWHDDSLNTKHYGLIETQQLDKLREELDKTNMDNKLKIFVVHHHVYQYVNPHPTWQDFSCMQNAQSLIELLSEYSFNFVIHGHRHVPYFLSTNIKNFSPINILCSGSYSCEVPTEISGSISNLFHIIETDNEEECKGRVISMAYDPTRYTWVKSKLNHGIEYENAFGIQIQYNDLVKKCNEIIQKNFAKEPFFEYNDLTIDIPDLIYLSNIAKKKLILEIEKVFNLTSSTVEDQSIIFIKRKSR